jgi:hypothetical protein
MPRGTARRRTTLTRSRRSPASQLAGANSPHPFRTSSHPTAQHGMGITQHTYSQKNTHITRRRWSQRSQALSLASGYLSPPNHTFLSSTLELASSQHLASSQQANLHLGDPQMTLKVDGGTFQSPRDNPDKQEARLGRVQSQYPRRQHGELSNTCTNCRQYARQRHGELILLKTIP